MYGILHRAAAVATSSLLLACGAAFAPGAHAAPADCGNNLADCTGSAFTIATTPVTNPPEGGSVTVNSDSTVTFHNSTGAFAVAASTPAVGGSGTVRMTLPVATGGPFPPQLLARPHADLPDRNLRPPAQRLRTHGRHRVRRHPLPDESVEARPGRTTPHRRGRAAPCPGPPAGPTAAGSTGPAGRRSSGDPHVTAVVEHDTDGPVERVVAPAAGPHRSSRTAPGADRGVLVGAEGRSGVDGSAGSGGGACAAGAPARPDRVRCRARRRGRREGGCRRARRG